MKIYGKLIAIARKNSNGSPCGLMDRTLEIYEIKTGLKGVLFKSSEKGWKRKENVISSALFKIEEGDATPYRVCEYFGFPYSSLNIL